MKTLHVKLVKPEDSSKLESILNMLRIGLNDWDRTKVFEVKGTRVINYTILCDDETFETIKNQM